MEPLAGERNHSPSTSAVSGGLARPQREPPRGGGITDRPAESEPHRAEAAMEPLAGERNHPRALRARRAHHHRRNGAARWGAESRLAKTSRLTCGDSVTSERWHTARVLSFHCAV